MKQITTKPDLRFVRLTFAAAMLLTIISSGLDAGADPCVDPSPPAAPVDCDSLGNCPVITVAGDPAWSGPGTFNGHADPTIIHDPVVADRMWLAYSWPHVVLGTDPGGSVVAMAAVENHLSRSDDGGETFSFVSDLWPAVSAADPEGSGEVGMFSSETASIVFIEDGGTTTWYGAHLRYFLRPITGYNPNYVTSWHVRIAVGTTPEALAAGPEAILGVSTTAAVYQPQVRLDELAGLPIQECGLLNNPTLYVEGQTLYLIVECLAFIGTEQDFPNSTTQVFATTPTGAPSSWVWRHAGLLADNSLAVQLSDDTIQQPDISVAADGTLMFVVTPAHEDAGVEVGTVGDGCVAIELESIDPPMLRRDCTGHAVVRASVEGTQVKACSYNARSDTGIIAGTELAAGGEFKLHATGVHPLGEPAALVPAASPIARLALIFLIASASVLRMKRRNRLH